MQAQKADIVARLRKEVLTLQGFKGIVEQRQQQTDLSSIENNFPNRKFPTGAIHEFVSDSPEHAVATNCFIASLLSKLTRKKGICLWVSTNRTIYPPALKSYGIDPENLVFIDLIKPKEALWVIEEALKCEALVAVVGEIQELGFTESRRLQLAVEHSDVTGFIHRFKPKNKNAVASVARWSIKILPSTPIDDLPGVGFPKWHVQLLKVRNGIPGAWQVEWNTNTFSVTADKAVSISAIHKSRTA